MKEDILEQLVDEYLQHLGYLTRHNIKFRPNRSDSEYQSSKDSASSDIDVIGVHPTRKGTNRVWVVSCKSWQGGFKPQSTLADILNNKKRSGREAWKAYRELTSPKWSRAFLAEVKKVTGTKRFTYVLAVTQVKGDRNVWQSHKPFSKAIGGNPILILTLRDILKELLPIITTTPASSSVGRILQLLKASLGKEFVEFQELIGRSRA
jgi:hypothetical protein